MKIASGLTVLSNWGLVALTCLGSSQARANSEVSVNSIFDGKTPYLVVAEDSDGSSKRLPGIYAPQTDGKWHAFLKGRVLSGGPTQGILAQLALTNVDHRYETVAVVDGKIRIFQINSSESEPGSIITIGSDEHPLSDVHGQPIQLPIITGVEDISVIQVRPSGEGQMLLFSVRLPSQQIVGDGITFGVFLKSSTSQQQHLALAHPPIVIDYRFQSPAQLNSLVNPSTPFGVVSRLSLRALLQSNRNVRNSAMSDWRNNIQDFLEVLESEEKAVHSHEIPYVDLRSGKLLLVNRPQEELATSNFTLTQVFDPIGRRHGIYFGIRAEGPYDIVGKFDKTPNGRFLVYDNAEDNALSLAMFVDKELYFVTKDPSGTILRTKLPLENANLPTLLSFHSVRLTAKGESAAYHYALISSKSSAVNDPEKTVFYLIRESNGTLFVVKHYRVFNSYISEPELALRLVRHSENGKESVLFDNLTNPQADRVSYQQSYVDTRPHLDLTASTERQAQQAYVKSLAEEILLPNTLFYRIYDPVGASTKSTGLYIYHKGQRVGQPHVGELLRFPNSNDGHLFSREFKLPGDRGSAQITVFAIDRGFSHGSSSFQFIMVMTSTADASSPNHFPPVLLTLPISLPFSELLNVSLVQELKENRGTLHALLAWRRPDQSVRDGNVLSLFTGISFDSNSASPNWHHKQTHWLSSEPINGHEVVSRIRYSADGIAFWVNTPHLPQSDPGFGVTDLRTKRAFLVNSASFRGTKLLSPQDSQKALSSGLNDATGQLLWSNWEVSSRYTLEHRVRKVEPGTKDGLNNLFVGLDQVLDAIATRQQPIEHRVIFVSSEMKDSLLDYVVHRLQRQDRSGAEPKWNLENPHASFFWVDSNKASQAEVLRNLLTIRTRENGKRPVLVAEAGSLLSIGFPKSDSSSDDRLVIPNLTSPDPDQQWTDPHILYLLATEGRRLDQDLVKSSSLDRTIPMVILATPDEWRAISEQMRTVSQEHLLDQFVLDNRFLTASWKVWPPATPHTTKEIILSRETPVTPSENDVLPNVLTSLEDMADESKPSQHRLLIIPDDLKPLVRHLVLSGWSGDRSKGSHWNYRNPTLDFYRFQVDGKGQASALQNLATLRAVGGAAKRPVLLAELSDLVKAGRLANPNSRPEFRIHDVDASSQDHGMLFSGSAEPQKSELPHILYLLATEGQQIQPYDFAREHAQGSQKVSMLLIGSRSEWNALIREFGIEARYDLASHFDVIELKAPNPEMRRSLLARLVSSSSVQSLGYKYDASEVTANAKDLTAIEARDRIFAYLVNRAETLSVEFKQETTAAFIRILSEFSRSLIEDPTLRHSKVIDRSAVERLLSRVFPIPLSTKVLPPNDPLAILSREDAPLLLQEAGYEGPLELKIRVIRAMLAQMRSDPVKSIPSSIILFGETSSGKTFLFETLCKVQGLKLYDFNQPNDETAGAIIINVSKLTDGPSEGAGLMTVDEALRHLDHFQSLPRGYRGHILFDDIHKADQAVISKLITYLQTRFDAPNGLVRVKNLQGDIREVPTRNMTIFMTLNPTQDQEKLQRFRKRGTDAEIVVATLSGSQFQVDPSFLQRWGLILSLNSFPVEAKAPKLQESLRNGARNDFRLAGRLVVVSPQAVSQVVSRFPSANAREFLSVATTALLTTPSLDADGGFFIVRPVDNSPRGPLFKRQSTGLSFGWEASGRSNAEIETYIHDNMIAIPVNKHLEGQMSLLSIMLDTFRTNTYEALVGAATQSPLYATNQTQLRAILAPMLHSITASIVQTPYLPLSGLGLDPFDFHAETELQQETFRKLVESDSNGRKMAFPIKFHDEILSNDALTEILEHGRYTHASRSRTAILTEFSERLKKLFIPYMEYLLRVPSLQGDFPTPKEWMSQLKDVDSSQHSRRLGTAMSALFLEMWEQMYEPSLVENMDPTKYRTMTTYDAARLFLISIDRAISKLPWGKATRFMTQSLTQAASDLDLGQMSGIQHYLFSSKQSLLRPATHELIMQMALNSQAYASWSEEQKKTAESGFLAKCELLLVQR